MMEKSGSAMRKKALTSLTGWRKVKGREAIEKTYQFKNFNEAFGWMSRIAMIAEKMDHHPEWFNVYRTVDVVLTTHDTGGVSEKDIALARAMDRLAGSAGRHDRRKPEGSD